ncbi:hypothetical protein [Streptomyces sp. 4N124]|uniref:hypothetical protein n=1 Tax=Streptomyces sp. 4N124 TaxID=3457420 RepID=UPI003FD1A381
MTDWWAAGTGIASAAATISATGLALWVAVRDGRLRDAERRDQEAAQARLVTRSRGPNDRLRITNHSALPIMRLNVRAEVHEADGAVRHLAIHSRRHQWWHGPVLAGGASVDLPVSHRMDQPGSTLIASPLKTGETITVTMQVLDAQGLWWERENDHPPVRLL